MSNERSHPSALADSVRENPANRLYYHAALAHARERVPFDELASIVEATPAPATCTVRPKNAISNLVGNGALRQSIEVDGRPYEGGYEDLLADEGISADAEIVYYVELTAEGEALLASIDAGSQTDALFESKPSYSDGLIAVLDLCSSSADGVTRQTIEGCLRALPDFLRIDESTGLETVSPSFYTTNLEDAGALMWADGRWHVTEAGRAALARWK